MKILNISKVKSQSDRYDIQTGTKNFFANGILVHNSLIHTVNTDLGVKLKSKKTFSSAVALAAEKWMYEQPGHHVLSFVNFVTAQNLTAIFEWTAPSARIVLFYPEAELQLLHIRDNVTGVYMESEDLHKWAEEFNVKVVEEVEFANVFPSEDANWYPEDYEDGKFKLAAFNMERAKWLHENVEGVEGWVFQFEDGNMVKLKTDWYIKRHHAMTFIRERDIAQLVLDEGLDDMKAMLVSENVNIDRILEIEQNVVTELNVLRKLVDSTVKACEGMDRKTFAIAHNSHKYFSLLMRAFSGQEPNYKDYFEKNILKEKYGQAQVVMMPSIAEGD
jgi:RNA ligase